LVENDPDVDSLFRLICNNNINWKKNKEIIISNENMCVFNTQNTFWIDKSIFFSMFIPTSVSFRYYDILRSIITNVILNHSNKNLMYISPNVRQDRNEHNLMKDFELEIEMFINNEKIVNYIDKPKCLYLTQSSSNLPKIYDCIRNKIILLSYKENTKDTNIYLPNSS